MKIFIYFLLSLCCQVAIAKETLRGKVVDIETNVPIIFMNIVVEGHSVGTSTNEEGEFSIQVDGLPQKLVFSHLNYEKITLTVNSAEQLLTIKATPASRTLPEVTIDPNFARNLIIKAVDKAVAEKNNKFYGRAFYRQKTRNDDSYTGLHEVFYNMEASSGGIEGWTIEQARYAIRKASEEQPYMALTNFSYLSIAFPAYQVKINDIIHPVSREVGAYYNLELKDFINYEGIEVAVVEFTPKANVKKITMSGQVYIDVNTFNILKLSSRMPVPINIDKSKYAAANSFINFELIFKVSPQGISLLNYIKTDHTYDLIEKKKSVHKVHTSSILFFYEYDDHLKNKTYSKVTRRTNDLTEIKKSAYNKEFWQNNPIIQRTPVEEEVIRSFEEEGAFGNMIEQKK